MQITFSDLANSVFQKAIADYHLTDNVDQAINNPYERGTIEYKLYAKNWIDCVQWHLEDLIRDLHIDPVDALHLKRRIDKCNQERTDLVEMIDSYFLTQYSEVMPHEGATVNTESPGCAIDRMSILSLKIYHMDEQTRREEAGSEHVELCRERLALLLEQQTDLSVAVDQLLDDIAGGRKRLKMYRQMKMYNDPATNPVLYGHK